MSLVKIIDNSLQYFCTLYYGMLVIVMSQKLRGQCLPQKYPDDMQLYA